MNPPPDPESLLRRLEALERENARLREKLEPLVGPDNPNFKPDVFLRVLSRTVVIAMIPLWLGLLSMIAAGHFAPRLRTARVAGLPVFSFADGKARGVGAGLISFAGLSLGAVAIGGVSVGLVAVGGMAVGVVAIGGGAFGVIAIGGGAVGVVAVGGGATGYFAIGQKARGRYVLSLRRQDDRAVEFFRKYVPGLHRALTNPLPVIPLAEVRRHAPDA